jgi:hypothetical protein
VRIPYTLIISFESYEVHISIRWLQILPVVNHLHEQLPAIYSYFMEELPNKYPSELKNDRVMESKVTIGSIVCLVNPGFKSISTSSSRIWCLSSKPRPCQTNRTCSNTTMHRATNLNTPRHTSKMDT